jgi:hypothetical protein
MPRRKPKMSKVVEEKIKETLDSIILDENLDSVETGTGELPRLKTTVQMDFEEEKISAARDAKSLLDSLAMFYLDDSGADNNPYLEYRKKIDSMNISSMTFQLKSAQHAITKLLEEIDMGNMTPRLFEVLAQLQGQVIQISKDHQAYLDKMEKSYKVMKGDIDQKNYNGAVRIGPDGDYIEQAKGLGDGSGIKVRGTRGLMENLRDLIGAEIVDVKPEEIKPGAVVNARDKIRMDAEEKGYEGEIPEGGDDFQIEDDLFN